MGGIRWSHYEGLADVPRLYEEKFVKSGSSPVVDHSSFIPCESVRLDHLRRTNESFEGSGEAVKHREINKLCREDILWGTGGSCLVADGGTLWVEDGWRSTKGDRGSLLLEFVKQRRKNFPRL